MRLSDSVSEVEKKPSPDIERVEYVFVA